jgi:hypothetical protein
VTVTGGNGVFQVHGSHSYAQANLEQVVVTLQGPGTSLTSQASLNVVAAPLAGTATPLRATPSVALSDATLGWFTDPNAAETAGAFVAKVTWGDGTPEETVSVTGGSGLFRVGGNHTYSAEGAYNVVVRILRSGAQALTLLNLVMVAPPARPVLGVFSVQFKDGFAFSAKDTGGPFNKEQWRVAGDPKGISAPYIYVQGSTLKADVRFALYNKDFRGLVDIQGKVYAGPPKRGDKELATLTRNGVNITKAGPIPLEGLKADKAFPKQVGYYPELTIVWQVRFSGQVRWFSAGRSTTPLYLTFAKPADALVKAGHLVPTLVQLGCQAAATGGTKAKTDPQALFDAIWKEFATRKVKRAADSRPLQYYGQWTVPPLRRLRNGAVALIRNLDGQCTTWADLLLGVIDAQGLRGPGGLKDVTYQGIQGIKREERGLDGGFLTKAWKFAGPGAGGAYPYTNRLGPAGLRRPRFVRNTYRWFGTPQVTYTPRAANSARAQNNTNPLASFPNHAVVRIGTKIYDPSYGQTYTSLQDFQDKAIDGFYTRDVVPGVGAVWRIRRNKPGAKLAIEFFDPGYE